MKQSAGIIFHSAKDGRKVRALKETAMYALKWIVNTGSLQETQPANIRIHLKALSETVSRLY